MVVGRHSTQWRWILPALLILMTGCLVSAKAFQVFFAADDLVYIAYAESRPWPGFVDGAAHRWLSGAGAFYVSRRLFDLHAGLFHIPVVAAHLLNALLLWRLVLRLEPMRPRLALVAAIVFVGHAAAFTVLAWLSAGFNEAPALTAALVATYLTLKGMERGSISISCMGGVVIFLATGFKQHVVLAVAYVGMFGLYYGLKRLGPWRSWIGPLVAAVIVVSGVGVWLATVVVKRMPDELFKPPYTRVYTPSSVAVSYLRYLPHSLNPLAIGREPLGYQEMMPPSLAAWTRASPAELRAAMLIAWALAIWSSARRLGLLPLAGTAGAVLVAALSVAVVLPGHQYDYYAYFGLPVASILVAMPIGAVWRLIRSDARLGQVVVPAATAALFVAAWYQGEQLYSANAVAQHSQHTRIIDQVAEIVPSQSTLYFIKPVGRAQEDTLQGASVALLQPDKALTTKFAETPGVPDTFAASSGLWLVATRPAADDGWEAMLLDFAQWRNAESSVRLTNGAELRQPFTVGGASLSAVEVDVLPWRGGCEVAFRISAVDGSEETSEPLAEGRLECVRHITHGVVTFPVAPGRIVRGRYVLSIRLESGSLDFPVARAVDIGFAPLSYRNGNGWEQRPHTLAIRGVLGLVESHSFSAFRHHPRP